MLLIPMVSDTNLLKLYEFLPLPIHFNFVANISNTLDVGITNLKLFPAPTGILVSTFGTPSFAREGR